MTDTIATHQEEQRPVRFGVIGAGWFASRRHLPEIKDRADTELTALCRRDPEARAKLTAHFGLTAEQGFEDWEQMLEGAALDAVLIATPNALHYAQAKAALERGLHVLLEKPMTIRSSEAWELVVLAAKQNRKLGVALNPPFWAHCHRMRRALRNEKMGALESAGIYWTGSAEYVFGRAPAPENLPGVVAPTLFRADPDQNGGGYFIDGGSHLVSELLWVTEMRARKVSCIMDVTPTDMRAVLTLVLENGAVCTINTIGDSKFPSRRVRNIFGATNGTITVNGFEFDTTIAMQGHEPQRFKEADLMSVGQPVGNFVEAILGKAALFSPGEHGAHVVEVVEAAYESAVAGKAVLLPETAVPIERAVVTA